MDTVQIQKLRRACQNHVGFGTIDCTDAFEFLTIPVSATVMYLNAQKQLPEMITSESDLIKIICRKLKQQYHGYKQRSVSYRDVVTDAFDVIYQ